MSKVTKQVDIKYVAIGLENIIKSFEKLDPSQLSDKAKKAVSELSGTAKVMLDQINMAMQKGDMSEELARKYEKMFQNFIGPEFDRKFKAVLQGVGGDFDAAFSGMTAKAAQLAQELANIESTITVEQRGFEQKGDQLDFATQTKKNEVAAKALQQVLKENSDIEKESLTRAKKGEATYTNLEQNQQRINVALSSMSDAQKKNIDNFLKTGEITEQNRANVELLVQKMEGNLSVQEVQQRLIAKNLVDEKLKIELQNQYNKLKDLENQKVQKTNELKQAMDPVKTAQEEVEAQKKASQAQQTYNKNQAATVEILNTVANSIEESKNQHEKKEQVIRSSTKETERNTDAVRKNTTTLGKAANQVFNYGLAFTLLRRIYRETLRTIRDLDKALTEMAIVTTMNRKEAFALADTMANLARQTGFTTTEIAKLSTVYFRQGRTLSEVITLTEVSAKAARIAGISAADSANFLTSAVNAFQLSADQALAVSDRFAAIAAQSASSYEELAVGLSKFAAQANVAGVSIDFAMGLLAKGVETTREAPETIGTALKTVIARMRELTDLGKTFEDGMDISRVETALRQVGIALRDEQGQFRDLEQVLTEIGMSWQNYNRNQQAAIAVALAGTRQQSRLIAIMQDFDRTLELVNVSQESAGATNAQQVEFMQSLQAATIELQTAWQDFIRTIGETETIIGIVKLLTFVIDSLTTGLKTMGFAGKNATVILVGLVVLMRSWKTIINAATAAKKLYAAAMGASNLATKKSIIYTGANGKMILFSTAAMAKFIAVAAPILLIIAALIIGFNKLSKSQERSAKKFQEATNKINAANYEINRTLRSINTLRSQIEKLNQLSFLTPEQEEELETLKEKFAETIGEEFVVRLSDGTIFWEQTLERIADFENQKIEELRKNRQDLLKTTLNNLKLVDKVETRLVTKGGTNRVQQERVVVGQELAEPLTLAQRQNFANFFVQEFQDIFDTKIDPEIEKQYRRLVNNLDLSVEDIGLLKEDPSKFIENRVKPAISTIESFNKSIEDAGNSLQDRVSAFNENITKIADKDIRDLMRKEFSDLNFIVTTGLDANVLESLGITEARQMQEAFRVFNTQLGHSLTEIQTRADELTASGIPAGRALRLAFAQAARATDDAAARVYLYNQAFKETTLEVSQNLDTLTSRIKRIDQVQKDWIEGTIAYQDLFEFFQSSSDLFKSMDDVERFLSGESMQADAIIAKVEAQRDLVVELYYAWEEYNNITEETTEEQKQLIISNIAFLSSITQYRGSLTSLTEEQHRFNATLEEYKRFSDLGIDTTELSTRLLQEQAAATAISTQKIQERLSSLRGSFEQVREELGLEGEFDDYFQIINGQIVPVFESLEGLTDAALTYIDSVLDSYQSTLNEAFDDFKAMRDQALKIEKESLDKQKKAYQDYFAALDRLEAQRERKKSREDLVSQLSRLEGATDERSRRRALELRRELNALDDQQSRDTQAEARESLLRGFDERYAQLEKQWADAAEQFIINLSQAGSESGNAFVNAVIDSDLADELELTFDTAPLGKEFTTFVDKMKAMFKELDLPPIAISTTQDVEGKEAFVRTRTQELIWQVGSIGTGNMELAAEIAREMAEQEAKERFGFAKGGMVDFEGLAMLHGSKSAPEAVLNPMQTEMFLGLRDALEKVSFNSNGASASVNIENISISTASLNNNQDFKRAGESLADAFKNAIQRKGITVNTNKV